MLLTNTNFNAIQKKWLWHGITILRFSDWEIAKQVVRSSKSSLVCQQDPPSMIRSPSKTAVICARVRAQTRSQIDNSGIVKQ